ncbi:vegetative cell wall protein gp1-like [Solanum lycopersicum]|uniref:vegetative cell wall protein gp1-like n=1 Tax=Solanum lycopersicum TaxID=4081 RepID=UPI003747F87C
MLRVFSAKYYTRSSIFVVQKLTISVGLTRKMSKENLPSDFPTTTPPNTGRPTDAPPAVEDSPFVPDFDAIPPIRPGENPPTPSPSPSPSPSPTAPRTDSPEFSDPPNTSPSGQEAPRPPISPPGQPEAFTPQQPPDAGEQIRTSNVRSE